MSLAPATPLSEITEKQWDAQLFAAKTGLAPMLGWNLSYHTLRSKGSASGFPDRVIVRERIVLVETKSEAGKISPAQRKWLDGLARAGGEVYLWRPSDLDEAALVLGGRHHWEIGVGLHRRDATRWVYWEPVSMWLPGVGRRDGR